MNKTVYILCGPTAVGKTAFAIALAEHLQTEIISADSRQCFRELGIAVAKPTASELKQIQHHFIDSHSIDEELNAGKFEAYALAKVETLFQTHDAVVMVGGTGLYIKAFCEGMDEMPTIDSSIRDAITNDYETKGLSWLQAEVAQSDPIFWMSAEQENPQRLMRALEMIRATGISITTFRKSEKKQRPFRIVKIGLELPRELLNQRINQRVDQMVEAGLIEEAKTLLAHKKNNALQTVGYQELFDHFDGKIDLYQALDLIKQHTRQYAKRQMTWFKKDKDIFWLDARTANVEEVKR
ncbi:MAG: tRNA (adenosine(37)-N6)-dimethylallyltransferase MiaA [Bacteroidetes bacterium]|nr:tRNA (adenosine(37)-N6)-dimethylallyltransferase MiaA [Bacteroidota bacterium]